MNWNSRLLSVSIGLLTFLSIQDSKTKRKKLENFQKTNAVFNHGQKDNLIGSVFIKDLSFEHEKEFRIILREKVREIPPTKYKENISNSHILSNIHKIGGK